jgi:hypothetical protein
MAPLTYLTLERLLQVTSVMSARSRESSRPAGPLGLK